MSKNPSLRRYEPLNVRFGDKCRPFLKLKVSEKNKFLSKLLSTVAKGKRNENFSWGGIFVSPLAFNFKIDPYVQNVNFGGS